MSEYPFGDKQKIRLRELAERHEYRVITIRLTTDFGALWQRRYKYDREPDRHLNYITDHYHYGDILEGRPKGMNHTTKEISKKIITDRKYSEFQLGALYEFDITDYTQVDYALLLDKLEKEINDNR